MSAIGGKADIRELPSGCLLIARSGHSSAPSTAEPESDAHLLSSVLRDQLGGDHGQTCAVAPTGAFSRLGLAGRRAMKLENFFHQHNVIDLSFFNFRNAITAAYFANKDLEILKVNENFRSFFPVLGNVANAYFPDVLEQLGVPGAQIENFVSEINEKGCVLIPAIHISIDGTDHVYSLLSARTHDDAFSYLNGVQGQFVDRTAEWHLRKEREEFLEQKIRDREVIEAKNRELEGLSTKLSKYLSPQVYSTIFTGEQSVEIASKRKSLQFSSPILLASRRPPTT